MLCLERERWGGLERHLRAVGSLISPTLCEVCGGPSPSPGRICHHCWRSLAGAPGPAPESGVGLRIAGFRYEGEHARAAVHRFKYAGASGLAEPLADGLVPPWRESGLAGREVWLVPVAIAADRHRLRGYNQAALLAGALGRRLALPVVELLRRHRSGRSQTTLDPIQREQNINRVFAARPVTPYLPVVLVDDVWTTGATVRVCRRVLESAGHNVIGAATAFWTPPPRAPGTLTAETLGRRFERVLAHVSRDRDQRRAVRDPGGHPGGWRAHRAPGGASE